MKRIDAASLLLLALCLAGLLARLSCVPAMSLDEAWIGLFAQRLSADGVYTPHQMNLKTAVGLNFHIPSRASKMAASGLVM